jgi:polyribonucleotide nucleotidyltransferase
MGLIMEDSGDYAILSDILGDEDHLGDMDFKVAGTENGITSLQMDIKIAGITPEIMEKALEQAKDGRMHILGEMNKALTGAAEFSVHAPRIETMQVPTDKIREVIGSGGKVIREIVEVSGAKVDINDEGIIKIASPNGEAIKKAYDMIRRRYGLHRQSRQNRRLRCIRELLRQTRRSGARVPNRKPPLEPSVRRSERRSGS